MYNESGGIPMNICFVGSEATPFSKTGGLADVLGSLPGAMKALGHDVSLIIPKHLSTKERFDGDLKTVDTARIPVGQKREYAGFQHMDFNGIDVYAIDNEYYFGYRENLYGDFDDGERYAYFNHAVLSLIKTLELKVDVLHLNDWQTGLIPYILEKDNPLPYRPATVFTIHNIAYQGQFDKGLIPYLNVAYDDRLEFDHGINFLKTAIVTADLVTTVSKTYKEELKYAYFGYGMEDLLADRGDRFKGVMNGLGYETFSPSKDPHIAKTFDLHNYIKGKTFNKTMLLRQFNLEPSEKPLFAVVSRLAEQKGMPLILEAIEPFLEADQLRFVVLGSGDTDIEDGFNALREKHPEKVGIYLGYNDSLARQVYAGSDYFLMPSRFEPCGLSQLIAMRYGSLPIVRKTGGLKDSVIPYNKFTNEGTGLGFVNYDASDLYRSIQEALVLYEDQKAFKSIRRKAMKQRFSWEKSANEYETLYKTILRRP